MHLFSSWIKAVFLVALKFPLYSETAFVPALDIRDIRELAVMCIQTKPHFCTREMDPVCATDGQTYSTFCSEKLENSGKFEFSHYGAC